MMIRSWDKLPPLLKTDEVRPYYDILKKKYWSLLLKRGGDILFSLLLIVLLALPMLIVAVAVKIDSRGPVLFRQVRVTQYGKTFRICKFRTMVVGAEGQGTQVTTDKDTRITRVGRFLRKYRIDEIPQLFHILSGNMTFVGTRPEVEGFVDRYTPEMYATLLLPAGLTSKASLYFADEGSILADKDDIENAYITYLLPMKMKHNLSAIAHFSLGQDMGVLCMTVGVLFGKTYKDKEADA